MHEWGNLRWIKQLESEVSVIWKCMSKIWDIPSPYKSGAQKLPFWDDFETQRSPKNSGRFNIFWLRPLYALLRFLSYCYNIVQNSEQSVLLNMSATKWGSFASNSGWECRRVDPLVTFLDQLIVRFSSTLVELALTISIPTVSLYSIKAYMYV